MRKPGNGETAGPASERFRAGLSHPHRLSAVRCLARANQELHLADLARDVARREEAGERGPPDPDAAERIYVDLYHVHLPKLAEAGVVSFDAESKLAAAVDAGSLRDWAPADDHRDVLDAVPDRAE